jgi:hypothetical protein
MALPLAGLGALLGVAGVSTAGVAINKADDAVNKADDAVKKAESAGKLKTELTDDGKLLIYNDLLGIDQAAVLAPATETTAGLMSAEDKKVVDDVKGQPGNTITVDDSASSVQLTANSKILITAADQHVTLTLPTECSPGDTYSIQAGNTTSFTIAQNTDQQIQLNHEILQVLPGLSYTTNNASNVDDLQCQASLVSSDGQHMFLYYSLTSVYVSHDSGDTWGLASGDISNVAGDNWAMAKDNSLVVMGSADGSQKASFSEDFGGTFTSFATGPGTAPFDDYGYNIAVSADGNRLVVVAQNGRPPNPNPPGPAPPQAGYSTDRGVTWTLATIPGTDNSGCKPGGMSDDGEIVLFPRNVAGTPTAFSYSVDGGVTWANVLNADIVPAGQVVQVMYTAVVSPDGNTAYLSMKLAGGATGLFMTVVEGLRSPPSFTYTQVPLARLGGLSGFAVIDQNNLVFAGGNFSQRAPGFVYEIIDGETQLLPNTFNTGIFPRVSADATGDTVLIGNSYSGNTPIRRKKTAVGTVGFIRTPVGANVSLMCVGENRFVTTDVGGLAGKFFAR